MLTSHLRLGLPSGLPALGFPTKILYDCAVCTYGMASPPKFCMTVLFVLMVLQQCKLHVIINYFNRRRRLLLKFFRKHVYESLCKYLFVDPERSNIFRIFDLSDCSSLSETLFLMVCDLAPCFV
jgi:hypothetical protein